MVRIPQFRGAQVGAGVVVLTTFALLCEARMRWGAGAHLALTVALLLVVGSLLVNTPALEREARPWLAALCLSVLALSAVSLGRVGQLLGADGFYSSAGVTCPAAVVVAAIAWWCAFRRRAAASALVLGGAATVALLAFADVLGSPSRTLDRWLLLLAAGVLALTSLAQRDRRPQHGAQFANAGGLAVAVIGVGAVVPVLTLPGSLAPAAVGGLGAGWQLALAAAGFGLVAYGSVDAMRGPVAVGLLDLAVLVVSASVDDHSFLGWPLALLIVGAGFLAFGLRPTTPAPPEPRSESELDEPAAISRSPGAAGEAPR